MVVERKLRTDYEYWGDPIDEIRRHSERVKDVLGLLEKGAYEPFEVTRRIDLQGVRPAILWWKTAEGHRPHAAFTCERLIDAIYLQLFLHITEGRSFRRCGGCDSTFSPRRSNQKWCSDGCGGSARKRASYRNRKHT